MCFRQPLAEMAVATSFVWWRNGKGALEELLLVPKGNRTAWEQWKAALLPVPGAGNAAQLPEGGSAADLLAQKGSGKAAWCL